MAKTGRAFTASLKPAWSKQQIKELCNTLKGSAFVYGINHDKDYDSETGELIENHTHILIDYETPRKVSTVANLLGVEPNFVEVVRNKNAMLRYLTHGENPEKATYDDDEVIHNNPVDYSNLVLGASMSDKEIAEHIKEGRGIELLGVVSASKLRTIQAFLQFDRSGQLQKELRELKQHTQAMSESMQKIDNVVESWNKGLIETGNDIATAFREISSEIKRSRELLLTHRPKTKQRSKG